MQDSLEIGAIDMMFNPTKVHQYLKDADAAEGAIRAVPCLLHNEILFFAEWLATPLILPYFEFPELEVV